MPRPRDRQSTTGLLPRMEARTRKDGLITYRYHPLKADGSRGKPIRLGAALAAQPSNYSDWQQRRGVLADIVDEALASYEAWMAEDDYNATDALHKIMDHMRQRAASYAKPAQQPAPAWHDAPTTPGVWVCDEGDICYTWTAHNIEILDIEPEDEVRWFGPIPPDGDTK